MFRQELEGRPAATIGNGVNAGIEIVKGDFDE